MSLCPPLHPLPCYPPEVYPAGSAIQALPRDLHPGTGLAVQGPAGDLNAVGAPESGAEGLHPGPPAEGSWRSKT